MTNAFLLTRQWRDTREGVALDLWWATEQGSCWTQITGQDVVFFALAILEVLLICSSAIVFAIALLTLLLWSLQPWLLSEWGIQLALNFMTSQQGYYLLAILLSSVVLSLVPAFNACRRALGDGLAVKY